MDGAISSDDDNYASDDSDIGDISDDSMQHLSLKESLQYWALKNNESHTSINMLLQILRCKANLFLPCDARTLLRTPRVQTDIVRIQHGEYWHSGLKKCLMDCFRFVYNICTTNRRHKDK